jgi:hypothetical protein
MKRFVVGEDRSQGTLFPEHLDDFITEDNPEPPRFHRRLISSDHAALADPCCS